MTHKNVIAFCQDAKGTGTIWIQDIEVPVDASEDLMCSIAQHDCAEAWEYYEEDGETLRLDDIHCLGLATGSIEILYWNDIE